MRDDAHIKPEALCECVLSMSSRFDRRHDSIYEQIKLSCQQCWLLTGTSEHAFLFQVACGLHDGAFRALCRAYATTLLSFLVSLVTFLQTPSHPSTLFHSMHNNRCTFQRRPAGKCSDGKVASLGSSLAIGEPITAQRIRTLAISVHSRYARGATVHTHLALQSPPYRCGCAVFFRRCHLVAPPPESSVVAQHSSQRRHNCNTCFPPAKA
jgi:hypothetical protein